MSRILPILIFFIFNICSAQTFEQKEIKRLNSFEINLNNIDLNDQSNYLNLKTILEKERKRRTNKTFGIILTSLGALTTTFGTLVIANSKDDNNGVIGQSNGIGQSIGAMIIAVGAIELGISIPLFISTSKRKKERDELVLKYK
jgi:hypothetical protein